MLSKDPLDSAIRPYVKKEKFENCSTEAPITGLGREENGTVTLFVDPAMTVLRPGMQCCWSAVFRTSNESSQGSKKQVAHAPRRPLRQPSASDKQTTDADGTKENNKKNGKRGAVDSSIV